MEALQGILLRPAAAEDVKEILNLFVGTVSGICRKDYSQEQIEAWTSSAGDWQRWKNKINHQYFVVAFLDGKLLGFASLEGTDYLDLFYVHRDFQGRGIGALLLMTLEEEAKSLACDVLRADVSFTAKGFFESRGFAVLEKQTRIIGRTAISNYKMAKNLSA